MTDWRFPGDERRSPSPVNEDPAPACEGRIQRGFAVVRDLFNRGLAIARLQAPRNADSLPATPSDERQGHPDSRGRSPLSDSADSEESEITPSAYEPVDVRAVSDQTIRAPRVWIGPPLLGSLEVPLPNDGPTLRSDDLMVDEVGFIRSRQVHRAQRRPTTADFDRHKELTDSAPSPRAASSVTIDGHSGKTVKSLLTPGRRASLLPDNTEQRGMSPSQRGRVMDRLARDTAMERMRGHDVSPDRERFLHRDQRSTRWQRGRRSRSPEVEGQHRAASQMDRNERLNQPIAFDDYTTLRHRYRFDRRRTYTIENAVSYKGLEPQHLPPVTNSPVQMMDAAQRDQIRRHAQRNPTPAFLSTVQNNSRHTAELLQAEVTTARQAAHQERIEEIRQRRDERQTRARDRSFAIQAPMIRQRSTPFREYVQEQRALGELYPAGGYYRSRLSSSAPETSTTLRGPEGITATPSEPDTEVTTSTQSEPDTSATTPTQSEPDIGSTPTMSNAGENGLEAAVGVREISRTKRNKRQGTPPSPTLEVKPPKRFKHD